MSDPLESISAKDMSSLKFAKLHSPKMKSVYWRHFGFPTNEDDRIITKQNVVCIICHKVLTNHGNTTNLRAHLQHRHKDLFSKICSEHGIKIPARKMMPKVVRHDPHETRRKIAKANWTSKVKEQYNDSTQDSSQATAIGVEDQSMLYEAMVPMTYEDDEVIDADHFAKVEVGGTVHEFKHDIEISETSVCERDNSGGGPNAGSAVVVRKSSNTANYGMEVMDPYQLQDALVNMLTQDMRNVDSLYDTGMSQFIRALSGNLVIPSEKKIESLIKELHSDKLTTLSDQIKMHSQMKPFSLGFEIWTNVEQKHFLSIYYNYATDAPEYNLLNQLYSTFEYNKFISIDAVFEEFNLHNCTAAIVSYDYDDYLKHFLRNKNIPIILSYDVIVDKCLRNAFALPAVSSVLEEVKDVIMRYSTEISSKDVEIPAFNEDFPWTYYELLKFFSESVSWPDDVDMLVTSAKLIVDTLNPLSVTLDTLKGEEIPHSSMLSPITTKILNKRLAASADDDELISLIKNTVSTELQKYVLDDDHLTISALLDPRFHRLTKINNFTNCLQILTDRYKKILESEGATPTSSKVSTVKTDQSTSRKSNLELFFDIQENSYASDALSDETSTVESDFKRYRNEVYVSLDESPFLWWNKIGHIYGTLKRLACLYQCVPCVVNMNFKKPVKGQIYAHQRRYMLTGNLIDAILFLHDNNKCS